VRTTGPWRWMRSWSSACSRNSPAIGRGDCIRDKDLGVRLLEAIGDTDLALTFLPDLPVVRRVLTDMAEHMVGAPLPPNVLDGAGVTVDRMRAFAEATKRFYEAAPWRHLSNEDLMRVDAPAVEAGLSHMAVLGAARRVSIMAGYGSDPTGLGQRGVGTWVTGWVDTGTVFV
jgi:hypothetical protein